MEVDDVIFGYVNIGYFAVNIIFEIVDGVDLEVLCDIVDKNVFKVFFSVEHIEDYFLNFILFEFVSFDGRSEFENENTDVIFYFFEYLIIADDDDGVG